MASSTVSVVLRVTGLGVMQSFTRFGFAFVGVETNTLFTPEPEKELTDDRYELPNMIERNNGMNFMIERYLWFGYVCVVVSLFFIFIVTIEGLLLLFVLCYRIQGSS